MLLDDHAGNRERDREREGGVTDAISGGGPARFFAIQNPA